MARRMLVPMVLSLAVGGCQCSVRDERAPTRDFDAAYPTAGHSAPLGRRELCNNGIDDDQNHVVDDGCACAVGSTQPCYPEWPAYAGVGTCSFGVQACVPDGPIGRWAHCEGAVQPAVETCDDGLDEDCDGLFDEGCPCDVGATRSCFPADAAESGVGACAPGITTCIESDVFEGSTTRGWGPCEGAVGPTAEVCNGVDDDCDGTADDIPEVCDLVDNDCDGETDEGGACGALPPVFTLSRYWPPSGSGLLPPTVALYAHYGVPPEEAVCAPGEILIEAEPGFDRCVPAPPTDCPPGTHYDWTGAAWECVVCHVIVQFGGLFAYERACAPEPALTCPLGQVPTYRVESRRWECIPECNNGEYDRAYRNGALVCIPC